MRLLASRVKAFVSYLAHRNVDVRSMVDSRRLGLGGTVSQNEKLYTGHVDLGQGLIATAGLRITQQD
jgi:hypothetical protein